MTSPPDLATFVLARIAEDKLAVQSQWIWMTERHGPDYWIRGQGAPTNDDWQYKTDRDGDLHVSPRRVLADCEARRRIVDLTPPQVPHYRDPEREWESCPRERSAAYCKGTDLTHGPDAPCDCGADEANAHGGPMILRLLAAPYEGHPDYRPEWTP